MHRIPIKDMKPERASLVAAVHLLPIKDGKVLLLRRFNTGYQDGNYSTVAGHIDRQEFSTEAMVREAREEAGMSIRAEDLKLVHVMHRLCEEREGMDFFFELKEWEGEIQNREPAKCDDLSWFALDQLPANVVPYVRAGIEHYLSGKVFSEFDERGK